MNLLSCVPDVNRLLFYNEFLILGNKTSVRKVDEKISLIWHHEIPDLIYNLFIFENDLIIEYKSPSTGLEETTLISLENFAKNDIFKDIMFRSFSSSGKAIGLKYDIEFNSNTVLINLINKVELWEKRIEYLPSILNSNILLIAFKSKIKRLDLDGAELWSLDLTSFGTWIDYDKTEKQTEVSKVIGEHQGKIYVYLNSGKILILDSASGNQDAIILNDKNIDQGSFSGKFFNAIELDKNTNKLIQLFNQRYTEVNLLTYEVIQIHIEDMKRLNITNMDSFIFDDQSIYFSGGSQSKIASFNRATMKIEWVESLRNPDTKEIDEGRYGRELKLQNNKLYVLDNKNTLHIYERQAL